MHMKCNNFQKGNYTQPQWCYATSYHKHRSHNLWFVISSWFNTLSCERNDKIVLQYYLNKDPVWVNTMDTIYKIAKTFDKMLKFKMNIKNKTFPDYIPSINKDIWDIVSNDWEVLFYIFSHCDQKFTKHRYHIQIVNFTFYIFLEDVQAS